MRWRFHPSAADEYLQACQYYRDVEPELGVAFTRSFESAIDQIVTNPVGWRVIDEDVRRHLMKRFPYGVYYTVEADFVLVVSVAHMKRRPGYWRDRLK